MKVEATRIRPGNRVEKITTFATPLEWLGPFTLSDEAGGKLAILRFNKIDEIEFQEGDTLEIKFK